MIDTSALRERVLDLAIRGKLVPQDPNDEPASVLLERIRAEKEQMVKDGKLKAKDIKNDTIIFKGEDNLHYEKFSDGTVKCIEDEIPFDVPDGWAWMRLSNVLSLSSGKSIKIRELNDSDDYPVYGGNGINGTYNDYNVETDTIVIGRVGFYCGSVYKTNSRAWVTDNALIATLKVSNLFNADFLTYMLKYMKLGSTAVSSAQPVVSGRGILPLIIPVPPLIEQRRIVCSYVNILPYIENIENAKRDTKELTSSIKSKILDLAIRGKLVPQNQDDEPTSVLLERIKAEKEELIKQGKIKRDKKESVIFKGEDNSYYDIELPSNWTLTSLMDISLSISDGSHNPPPQKESGVPLLSAANIFDNRINYDSATRWMTEEEWEQENKRTNLECGDVLITIVGTIGRTAIISNEMRFALQRSVAVIKPCLINSKYLMYSLQSPMIKEWLNQNAKGNAQVGIYLKDLASLTLFLPPLEEQKRIVDAIETAFEHLDNILNNL